MTDKPEGSIWIEMTHMLATSLTVEQLVHVAALALNRLDMRAIGEICGEVGLRPELHMVNKGASDDRA